MMCTLYSIYNFVVGGFQLFIFYLTSLIFFFLNFVEVMGRSMGVTQCSFCHTVTSQRRLRERPQKFPPIGLVMIRAVSVGVKYILLSVVFFLTIPHYFFIFIYILPKDLVIIDE